VNEPKIKRTYSWAGMRVVGKSPGLGSDEHEQVPADGSRWTSGGKTSWRCGSRSGVVERVVEFLRRV
jgi:hypothetical protein